ncbi:MAG: homoserine O-succinyltransferase [Rhodothermaceae bacterium]|nr:MAG: homoserine O-succinyltransferase [Rhodothermaceae bacterium]
MPLVAHSPLPTFDQLRHAGQDVLPLEYALHQDIRELHIGLLNMMPDAALQVSERQFMRLIGGCNKIVQFFVHPFTVPGLPRSPEARTYLDTYYEDFETLKAEGLDALIITGANVARPLLDQEPFWEPLVEVIAWAREHVTSVLCSCLATHALLKVFHGIDRQRLPRKQWGVYAHRITGRHPLLADVNTRFDVPHSRWNEVTRAQLEAAGLVVLVESAEAGVHMAVSPDHLRFVYLQGHPEYDTNSLLKEYKREVFRYVRRERDDYPPYPEHYFPPEAAALADRYREEAERARRLGIEPPPFPEDAFLPHLDNTWGDTAKALFNNWLGLVYRVTDLDRHTPFKPGIDPEDPLGLRQRREPGEASR